MASSFGGAAVIRLLALALVAVQGQKLLARFDVTPDPEEVVVPNEPKSLEDCHFRYYEYGKYQNIGPSAGKATKLREYPHMAAIGWKNGTMIQWDCGGSLISEKFVLSAAHCAQYRLPDVVRLGDINLFDDSDDEFAQQIDIKDFIYPPNHTFKNYYYDIILLELERNVVLHETVAPACLWMDEEIPFKKFNAAGWGATEYMGGPTPNLLQITLDLIDRDKCNKSLTINKWLLEGLRSNQICAGHHEMDTCQGDSGGPLQVKLLHNSRLTPFVVAVTSFGRACSHEVPGAYIRVAPFFDWIKRELKTRGLDDADWILEPHACARKYVDYREYEPKLLLSKDNKTEQLDFTNAHLFSETSKQLVRIHWNNRMTSNPNECYGVIIDESTVLTLASCTMVNGILPTHVTFAENKTNIITQRVNHSDYEEGLFRNDIGVLKMKDPFEFNADFTPACVWTKQSYLHPEMEVTGRGLQELNKLFVEQAPEINRIPLSRTVDVLGIVMEQNGTSCSLPKQYADLLPNGLTQEHVCFGAKPFLVPKTCSQAIGGPLQREVDRYGRSLMYVNALNLFGRDCGFGESALAIRTSHHKSWLESVLYPPREKTRQQQNKIAHKDQSVPFLDGSLFEGDNCTTPNGLQGVCKNYILCPKEELVFNSGGLVKFCHTGSVLCCPHEYIRNATNSNGPVIDFCPPNIIDDGERSHNDRSVSVSNVVSIVWTNGGQERRCIGTIIATRTVLTAASCVDASKVASHVELPNSTETGAFQFSVEEVIVHPEFNNETKEHNLALIKTKDTSKQDEFLKPSACLWRNSTHTPFMMKQLVLVDESFDANDAHLKFNIDCRDTMGRILTPSELCLKVEDLDESVIYHGMPAFWTNRGRRYLVGIVSRRSSVSDYSKVLYTRISSYVDWIEAKL